jgi:hypothetical protein
MPLVLGRWRRTERLWCALGASRLAVRSAHSTRYARPRSSRQTGQRGSAGLPLPRAGLPGHGFLSPHGLVNVLKQTLHLASPIAPQGARDRHRLRPCHHMVGASAGEHGGFAAPIPPLACRPSRVGGHRSPGGEHGRRVQGRRALCMCLASCSRGGVRRGLALAGSHRAPRPGSQGVGWQADVLRRPQPAYGR